MMDTQERNLGKLEVRLVETAHCEYSWVDLRGLLELKEDVELTKIFGLRIF